MMTLLRAPLAALRRVRSALPVVAVAALVTACSTVPYSNRTRVILLSEGQEKEMGVDAYQQILSESQLSSDPKWTAIIQRVGNKIAAIAEKRLAEDERDPFEWEFQLIDAPNTVNAFCLPGGKVAFFTGILPICQDELGVAVVMGHEVGHALARHGGERVSQALVLNLGISIAAALASKDPGTQEAIAAALGVGAEIGLVRPFSRDHESEADYIGILMMAEAGYDPREAPKLWQRMAEQFGDQEPPEFLSTHPASETRVSDLNAALGEAIILYNNATGSDIVPEVQKISGRTP